MSINYDGWELNAFDKAFNFRIYQFEIILKYIKGNVAEIGPGTGQNIKYYSKSINKLHLYEPSKNLYLALKKKIKNSKIKTLNKKFKTNKNKFDTIMYLDVLEHIKNDKKEIDMALKSLKKNGNLIINVPAFQFLYSDFDKNVGHYRRYNKKNLMLLFKNKKYKKISFKYYDSFGFILSFLSKIFKSNFKNNFKQKIILWNFLIPYSKVLDKIIFNRFGKSLICIIQK
tara:strand:+ start:3860 stop:4543 length:684 start_codon:yes stop_codon:yes gene_type:complete